MELVAIALNNTVPNTVHELWTEVRLPVSPSPCHGHLRLFNVKALGNLGPRVEAAWRRDLCNLWWTIIKI